MAAPHTLPLESPNSVDYVQLSQDYVLPNAVKMSLDAAIQQANAIAIVMALFAGALVSFAQVVNGVDPAIIDTSSRSWGALLIFLYGSIILSLGGSFLSLIIIKMCSDLPLAAQQRILEERSPLSKKTLGTVARNGQIDAYILASRSRLLEHFGMSKRYKLVDRVGSAILLAACICTCASLTLWIFISEPAITAGMTMVFFGVTTIILILAYTFATHEQGWS